MSENYPEKDIVFAPMKLSPEVVEARREQLESKLNMSFKRYSQRDSQGKEEEEIPRTLP